MTFPSRKGPESPALPFLSEFLLSLPAPPSQAPRENLGPPAEGSSFHHPAMGLAPPDLTPKPPAASPGVWLGSLLCRSSAMAPPCKPQAVPGARKGAHENSLLLHDSLGSGLANIFCKEPESAFSFAGHAVSDFCRDTSALYWVKPARGNTETEGAGQVCRPVAQVAVCPSLL